MDIRSSHAAYNVEPLPEYTHGRDRAQGMIFADSLTSMPPDHSDRGFLAGALTAVRPDVVAAPGF